MLDLLFWVVVFVYLWHATRAWLGQRAQSRAEDIRSLEMETIYE